LGSQRQRRTNVWREVTSPAPGPNDQENGEALPAFDERAGWRLLEMSVQVDGGNEQIFGAKE
jgi:hypothetical protein